MGLNWNVEVLIQMPCPVTAGARVTGLGNFACSDSGVIGTTGPAYAWLACGADTPSRSAFMRHPVSTSLDASAAVRKLIEGLSAA